MQVLGPAQSDALGCGDLFYEVLRDSDRLRGGGETYLLLGGSRVRAGGEGAGLWRHRPSGGAGPGVEGTLTKPSGYLGVQDQSGGPDAPGTHCERRVPVCWAVSDSRVKAGQERQSDWTLCRWSLSQPPGSRKPRLSLATVEEPRPTCSRGSGSRCPAGAAVWQVELRTAGGPAAWAQGSSGLSHGSRLLLLSGPVTAAAPRDRAGPASCSRPRLPATSAPVWGAAGGLPAALRVKRGSSAWRLGPSHLCGVAVTAGPQTGFASSIGPFS